MTRRRALRAALAAAAVPGGLGAACLARRRLVDREVRVDGRCPEGSRVAVDAFDHSGWDRLLGTYVDSRGRVDYDAWRARPGDLGALRAYLESASCVDPDRPAGRPAVLAFWINLYNALTVFGILREPPVRSIRDLQSETGGYRIWDDLTVAVGGRPRSLNGIEHEILRPLGEPRVHFAIVCASVGCPRLRAEAYSADPARLEAQLADNARDFFAAPARLVVDAPARTLRVSPILEWFAGDFGADPAARVATIRPYLPPEAARLVDAGPVRLESLPYDWSLNGRGGRPRGRAPGPAGQPSS